MVMAFEVVLHIDMMVPVSKGNRYLKVEPYAIWQLSVAVADFTIHVCKGTVC